MAAWTCVGLADWCELLPQMMRCELEVGCGETDDELWCSEGCVLRGRGVTTGIEGG